MTGTPVVMVFCRMEPDGRYHIEFRPAFQVPKDTAQNGETGRWVRHFLEILEDQVRRYPEQQQRLFLLGRDGEPGGVRARSRSSYGLRKLRPELHDHIADDAHQQGCTWRRMPRREASGRDRAAAGTGPGWSWP